MNRRNFLIFAGTLGTGFVSAPFLGSMGRLMPSFYYSHHTNGNSQNQDQGNNNDNCYIRAEEATTSSNDQNGVDLYSLLKHLEWHTPMKPTHLKKISKAMALCAVISRMM